MFVIDVGVAELHKYGILRCKVTLTPLSGIPPATLVARILLLKKMLYNPRTVYKLLVTALNTIELWKNDNADFALPNP